ncbi:two component transcriptional regulator, Fis family [Sideroxydans lithotrophicus ES-1]|uniref:Two component transcriptional regulator, Fis family n=1 Tax=Sideroxydans lithotrophicus (strain ES-1) TaxID=580332 RepID=D5CTE9_SIDLE|nr:response regulator [Sideroxydans lithotrophicus]ADE10255.1 two component transcriptional regulator, Fis family [Sideroxydans lithotrophicus ES-1]
MATKDILVVDDEVGIRELLSEILFDEGYRIHLAENASQARTFRENHTPDLVLLDIWMPDTDGLSLLKEWVAQERLTMPVIMMSGHGTIETAMEAMRIGASDFLEKPIALQKLLATVAKAIQQGVPTTVGSFQQETLSEKPEREKTDQIPLPLDLPLREAREHFDNLYFNYQMKKENGNISRIAEKAGIERTHLYRKLKQLGIKPLKKGSGETQ